MKLGKINLSNKKTQMVLLFAVFLVLLVLDMMIPDPLPILDELLLAIGTIVTGQKVLKGK